MIMAILNKQIKLIKFHLYIERDTEKTKVLVLCLQVLPAVLNAIFLEILVEYFGFNYVYRCLKQESLQ